MSDDKQGVPEGFELFEPGKGYNSEFGAVYLNQAARKIGFRVMEHHLNPFGALHGGAMATFADMQCVAVKQDFEGKRHTPTISLTIDYLAPTRLGDWVEAEVKLVKVTSTMVFTQALFTAQGSIVARSSAIYRYYSPKVRASQSQT
jgi:uncharacterized protein (TIGR00369 family)